MGWEEGDAAALRVEPALEDEGGSELVDFVTPRVGVGGIMTGSLQGSMRFGGGEALVPKVDDEICSRGGFSWLGLGLPALGSSNRGWLDQGFGDECFELVYKVVDTIGLAAAIPGEVQRIADYDAGAAVAACEAEDGTLVPAGLCALEGEERLRDAERIRERDTDAARADIEAEPGLQLTRKWHFRHALMIARGSYSQG
jgi:hypothetical protein